MAVWRGSRRRAWLKGSCAVRAVLALLSVPAAVSGGVSVGVLLARPAHAAGCPISLTTNSTSEVQLGAVGYSACTNFTLTNGHTISASSGAGGVIGATTFSGGASVSGWTFVNDGTITSTETYGLQLAAHNSTLTNASAASSISGTLDGAWLGPSGTVVNAGKIRVTGSASAASGLYIESGVVTNSSGGTISGYGYGVLSNRGFGATGTASGAISILNAGTLSATGSHGAGIGLGRGGTVSNASTGVITGARGIYGRNATVTLNNAGHITGVSYGAELLGGGYVSNAVGGIISGTIAAVTLGGTTLASVRNQSSATISGVTFGIEIGSSLASVVNSGLVKASAGTGVYLRAGGYVLNHSTSTISGVVYGVEAKGGAATVENFGSMTATDAGVLIGGQSGTLINKGFIRQTSSTASGDAGAKIFGGYVHNFGGGYYASTIVLISGFNGVLADGASASINNAGTILGTGAAGEAVGLDFGGAVTNAGTGVIIGGTGIYSGTGAVTVSNAGLVQGTSGSAMSLTLGNAAGYVRNTGTVAGKSDGIYAAGGLVTIWNSGAITATQTAAVALLGGGSVTNVSGGVIAGVSAATATGLGIYGDTIATVINQSGATISGTKYGLRIASTLASVNNAGVIIATNATSSDAVSLELGGVVANQAGGTIFGGYAGLFSAGGDVTLRNAGSLVALQEAGVDLKLGGGAGGYVSNASGGVISARVDGVLTTLGLATVVNAGAIRAFNSTGLAVNLESGGVVVNQAGGTLTGPNIGVYIGGTGQASLYNAHTGTITGDEFAVKIASSLASVGNAGFIYATIASNNKAVALLAGGTVNNAAPGSLVGSIGVYSEGGPVTIGNAGTIWAAKLGVQVKTGLAAVYNAGLIIGSSSSGIRLQTGGAVTNASGGVIEGLAGGSTEGVFIYGDTIANVLNRGGGAITGAQIGVDINSSLASVYNAGTIMATLADQQATGVELGLGGAVTNISGGTISADYHAVYSASGPASVWNAGSIYAWGGKAVVLAGARGVTLQVTNASGGTIAGAVEGILIKGGAPGYVDNAGVVRAFASNGIGIELQNAGTMRNSASVYGAERGVEFETLAGTLLNSGMITGGSQEGALFTAGGYVSNSSTGRIAGAGKDIYVEGAAGSVYNAGTIIAYGGQAQAILLAAGGSLDNAKGGTISANDRGLAVQGAAGTVVNAGMISAISTGVTLADAILLSAGGSVRNLAGGTIYGSTEGLVINDGAAGVYNAGTIRGVGNDAVDIGGGGYVSNAAGGVIEGVNGVRITNGFAGTLINAGLIAGAASGPLGYGAALYGGGSVVNQAGGTITSGRYGVFFKNAAGYVTNQGSIHGGTLAGVYLGDGGAVVNSYAGDPSIGTITGGVYGVTIGGAIGSVENLGLIEGGSIGVGLSDGGAVTNGTFVSGAVTYFGTIAGLYYGVRIGGGAGSVVNAGLIAARSSYGVVLLDGGAVTNAAGGTIASGGGGVGIFAAAGYVLNQGSISGGALEGVDIRAGTVANLGAGAVIAGNKAGVLIGYVGDTENNFGYVTNSGYIRGGSLGVGLFGAGGSSGVVVNAGTIEALLLPSAGVYLANGGSVGNAAGGVIEAGGDGVVAAHGFAGVYNAGLIGGNGAGVNLAAGGFVDNTIAGAAFGTIGGLSDGVSIAGGMGTVLNAGSIVGVETIGVALAAGGIVGNAAGGVIYGGQSGVTITGGPGTVVNAGLIAGPRNYGVYLGGGGAVTNALGGTITSNEGGVAINGGVGYVLNQGTINGSAWDGVYLTSGGSVANLGAGATIIGTEAGVLIGYAGNTGINFGQVTNRGYIGGGTAGVALFGTLAGLGSGVVVNSGTILAVGDPGAGVYLFNGGAVTNALGGVIEGYVGVGARAGYASVYNAGSIFSGVYGAELADGGFVSNAVTGTIFGGQKGVDITGGLGTVVNAGLIDGQGILGVYLGGGGAVTNASGGTIASHKGGVQIDGAQAYVLNQGTITAGIWDGVHLVNGGSVANLGAGATITGPEAGVLIGYAHDTGVNFGQVTNSGYIGGGTVGVALFGTLAGLGSGVVVNAGTIVATLTPGAGVYLYNGGTLSNAAGGLIKGAVGVGAKRGYASLYNAGRIGGSFYGVELADGGAVDNTVSGDPVFGTITGGMVGVLIGGAAGTVQNDGLIAATDQNAASMGVSLAAGGTVTNAAGAVIEGYHQGIQITGAPSEVYNAGTILADGESSQPYGGYGGVHMESGGTLTNAAGAVISGADYGVFLNSIVSTLFNAGTIDGRLNSGVILKAGGYVGNAAGGTILGGFQAVYVANAAGTVVNAGSIQGDHSAVWLKDGGTILNQASGTIRGATHAVYVAGLTGTLTNYGVISDSTNMAVWMADGGTIDNMAGGTLVGAQRGVFFGAASPDAVLSNAGTVIGRNQYGVFMDDGGTVSNSGYVYGHVRGVFVDGGAGTVSNSGTILSVAQSNQGVFLNQGGAVENSGLIHGAYEGVFINSGRGAVSNSGTISSGDASNSDGVFLNDGGSLGNSGYIYGGARGVFLQEGGSGTVTNSGRIVGRTEYGVWLQDGGTLSNSGTIFGGKKGFWGEQGRIDVFNSGVITGQSQYGVWLQEGGSLGNTGTIGGGKDGVWIQGGSGIVQNSGTIFGGSAYGVWLNTGGTVLNAGVIASSLSSGVRLDDAGLYNETGGTITGGNDGVLVATGAGAVVNAGSISGGTFGVQLQQGGGVTNMSGGVISAGTVGVYVAGGAGSVANAGMIHGGAEGVAFADGGFVTNQLGGVISGGTYGVYAGGTGLVTVVNDGYIGGGSFGVASGTLAGITLLNYGTLEGGKYGVWAHDTGANALTNQAVIESKYNVAVFIGNTLATAAITGTLVNAGTISGARYGVQIGYAGNTRANTGTVANTGSIFGGKDGVAMFAGGYVTNAVGGAIYGGTFGVYAGGTGHVTVVNDGYIGGGSFGVASGTLAGITLLNYGTLEGGRYGVWDHAAGVNSLTNEAVIISHNVAVFIGQSLSSAAVTGTLVNDGGISGGRYGVQIGYLGNTQANAGTIFNAGSIHGGQAAVALFAGGYVGNAPGAGISGGVVGIYVTGASGLVVNAGSVFGGDVGVWLDQGGVVNNTVAGDPVFGTIYGGQIGVEISHAAGSVFNEGTIIGRAGTGVALDDGGYVTNALGALIEGGATGISVLNVYGSVVNAGVVSAGSVGIYLGAGGTVGNGGTIRTSGLASAGIEADGFAEIANAGTIYGAPGSTGILLKQGGSVFNAGTIEHFDSYGVVVRGAAGTLINTGLVYGFNRGVAMYEGGSVANAGLITGGGDAVYVAGGAASVVNFGSISGFVAGVRADGGGTVVNTGSIYSQSGFAIAGQTVALDVLNAGRLSDGGGGGGVALSAGGTVVNEGGIYVPSGTGVRTDDVAAEVINSGSIFGNGGVYLGAGGYLGNRAGATIAGGVGGVWAYSGPATVVNAGSITGGAYGVGFADGGVVDNTVGGESVFGTITGGTSGIYMYKVAGTVINAGLIQATEALSTGVTLAAGGTVANAAGAVIAGYHQGVFIAGAPADIYNAGTILADGASADTFGGYAGVVMAAGGTLTNAASGRIGGADYGVVATSLASAMFNAGTIDGQLNGGVSLRDGGSISNAGSIYGGLRGIAGQGGTVAVFNSGDITGHRMYGVLLLDGGSVGNTGVILGGSAGVDLLGGVGSLHNAGEIFGGAAGVVMADGYATNLAAGSIAGGTGAYLGSLVSMLNSGVVTGTLFSGVWLAGGGTLSNFGGTVSGAVNGVYGSGGPAALQNTGLITGGSVGADFAAGVVMGSAGTIEGGAAGVLTGGSFYSQVYNYWSITGGTLGVGLGSGGGKVVNTAFITGLGETGIGVRFDGAGGLENRLYGTITGGADGAGVVLLGGGQVVNAGLIQGGYGVAANGVAAAVDNDGGILGGTVGVDLMAGGLVDNGSFGPEIGTISGGVDGVDVAGAAGTVANAGLIAGGSGYGVGIGASGTVLNTGVIAGGAGGVIGVYDGPTLANLVTVENGGLIDGGSRGVALLGVGGGYVANTGTVSAGLANGIGIAAAFGGTIVNEAGGLVAGGYGGIAADRTGDIVNAGTVIGTLGTGVEIGAGALANESGGVIEGGAIGLLADDGAVATNAGLIADSPAPGHAGALLAGGAQLFNLADGTIVGSTGVLLDGDGARLVDAGTIASTDGGDAIAIAPHVDPAEITLTTGADVIGTIDGGGTDGQIALTGSGSLSNTISGFGAGSALTIAPGADWAATGSWTVATVTNQGIFQPGNLSAPLTLTGNFVQASTGTLQVVVTPTLSSQFIVDGSAMLSGDLDYVFAPGTYEEKTYDFLTVTQGVTGGFSAVSYNGDVPAALAHRTNAVTQGANLVLSAGSSAPAGPPARVVVAPTDSGLFTAQAQAAAELSQQATDMLLDKAVNGSDAEAAACAAGAAMNPSRLSPRGTSLAGSMESAAAAAFCNAGGWVDADGGDVSQDGAGGYSADTAGFTAGIDRMFGPGTRVGFAVGYDATNLNDGAHGQGSSDITRLSLYASQPAGRFVLAGVLSEGILSATTDRATGVGPMGESHTGTILSGGVAVTTTVNLGDYALLPSAGVRFADVSGDGFAEGRPKGIAGAFAVDGQIPGYASVQPYVGLGIGRNFVTETGVAVSPRLSVGYEVQAAESGRSARLVAADGTVFGSDGPREDGGDALLGAGISAGKGNWALYVNYAAHVAGNWTAQVGEAGLRVGF
jgi:hypothetical protein